VAVTERLDGPLRATLAVIAPGTALRDGLERILRGGTGALIVLGYDKMVESLCTGGFVLDVEFSSTRLRELAKMDGAIVVDKDCTKILRAAVQLVPDPAIPTDESGTRHRTADRVNKQTDLAVISVSQSMSIIAIFCAPPRIEWGVCHPLCRWRSGCLISGHVGFGITLYPRVGARSDHDRDRVGTRLGSQATVLAQVRFRARCFSG